MVFIIYYYIVFGTNSSFFQVLLLGWRERVAGPQKRHHDPLLECYSQRWKSAQVKEKVILVALPLSVRKFLDLLGTDLDPSVKIKKVTKQKKFRFLQFYDFFFEKWCKCSSKNYFLVAPWKSLTKRAGSGSVNQRYGSGSVPKCVGSGTRFIYDLVLSSIKWLYTVVRFF